MRMMVRVLGVGFGLVFSWGVATAKADALSQPVSGSGGGFMGTGTLTAVSNGADAAQGGYTIQGISGDYVTGLIAPGGFESNDNQLYPHSNQLVSTQGFAFTATEEDTNFDVDIFAKDGGYAAHVMDLDTNMVADFDVTFDVTGNENGSSSSRRAAFASFLSGGVDRQTQTFQFALAPAASQASAVTPEPASFALLGTGFLGLAGLARRRTRP